MLIYVLLSPLTGFTLSPIAPFAWSLRASASLHLSDLPLSLSLPLPLSLLLDLVKWQDVFLLLTGWLAVTTLWALKRGDKERQCSKDQGCRFEWQELFMWVELVRGRMFTHPFLAFGFDADDRLSFGFVHNHSPLISPCQTNTINIQNLKKKCLGERWKLSNISHLCHLFLLLQTSHLFHQIYRK